MISVYPVIFVILFLIMVLGFCFAVPLLLYAWVTGSTRPGLVTFTTVCCTIPIACLTIAGLVFVVACVHGIIVNGFF